MNLALSVLDQTPVISGHSAQDAVAATLELAQATDALGYTRYWCAEHHGLAGVANPAPEVMIARLAAATHRIRVGSGGIMLPYYSPFKIAEQFLMLEAMFPDRIDLGVGRAPGGDQRTAQAVAAGHYNRGEHFAEQVTDLVDILSGDVAEGHSAYGVLLQPNVATRPQMWILGSSDFGGALAARLGVRFAFAHFINPQYGELVARSYRTSFSPGVERGPYVAVALFVICADTEREANDLAAAVDLRRVQMASGLNVQIPTIEEARGRAFDSRERMIIERDRPRAIIGTPERVAEAVLFQKERFVADEIVVLTVAASYASRLRSYELLAQAFTLDRTREVKADAN